MNKFFHENCDCGDCCAECGHEVGWLAISDNSLCEGCEFKMLELRADRIFDSMKEMD